MCTLIVLWRASPVAPLIVAQCRDEVMARPALDVDRWRTAHGVDVVSGRDEVAGGTWFGIGPHVVCGLTNRRDERGPRRGELSRGDVVVRALESNHVGDVERDLRARDGARYGPFSLLACDDVGDAGDGAMIYADNGGAGDAIRVSSVAPGVHVLGNNGLDNEDDVVVRTVGAAARALNESAGADEGALVSGLEAILARHGEGWPCVHLRFGDVDYGTRSAGVLVRRRASGAAGSRLFTTERAPCSSPWRDSSALLV